MGTELGPLGAQQGHPGLCSQGAFPTLPSEADLSGFQEGAAGLWRSLLGLGTVLRSVELQIVLGGSDVDRV